MCTQLGAASSREGQADLTSFTESLVEQAAPEWLAANLSTVAEAVRAHHFPKGIASMAEPGVGPELLASYAENGDHDDA